MHFAGVDGDDVASLSLHDTAPTEGFLSAAHDDTNPELVMGMAAECMRGIGRNRLNTLHSTAGYLELTLCHRPNSLDGRS